MLISKGVSKIIKKYGYLPVDLLKSDQNANEAINAANVKQENKK